MRRTVIAILLCLAGARAHATTLASGVSCSNQPITFDGTTFTCVQTHQIGGSTQTTTAEPGYFFYDSYTTAGTTVTTGTSEVVFSTMAIPAGTLNVNGMCIYFSCNNRGSAASLSRATRVYLDGTTLLSNGSVTSTNTDMHADLELCRNTSTTAAWHGNVFNGASSVTPTSFGDPRLTPLTVAWSDMHYLTCSCRAVSGNAGDCMYQYSKGDIH